MPGVHLTGFAAVVSVHITISLVPLKHASLTDAVPSLSVTLPAHGAPEVTENPPSGPHELIEVGGTGGCGATCKHPLIIRAEAANHRTVEPIVAQSRASAHLILIRPIRATSIGRLALERLCGRFYMAAVSVSPSVSQRYKDRSMNSLACGSASRIRS